MTLAEATGLKSLRAVAHEMALPRRLLRSLVDRGLLEAFRPGPRKILVRPADVLAALERSRLSPALMS